MECPEKWEAVGNRCQHLRDRLIADAAVLGFLSGLRTEVRRLGFADGATLMFRSELARRAATARLIRSLVHGQSGSSTAYPDQAAWAHLRLNCACDFLGQMFPLLARSGPVTEMGREWTVEAAMVWALTELWERRFDSWLKLLTLEWTGPFPFYGIEPAPEWL